MAVRRDARDRSKTERLVDELERRGLLPLVRSICSAHGVLVEEVVGDTRSMSPTRARRECWTAVRDMPGRSYSLPEIGRMFGRDHTTVAAGIAKVRASRAAQEPAVSDLPDVPDLLP